MRMFNVDETGFSVVVLKTSVIVFTKEKKQVENLSSTIIGDTITVETYYYCLQQVNGYISFLIFP